MKRWFHRFADPTIVSHLEIQLLYYHERLFDEIWNKHASCYQNNWIPRYLFIRLILIWNVHWIIYKCDNFSDWILYIVSICLSIYHSFVVIIYLSGRIYLYISLPAYLSTNLFTYLPLFGHVSNFWYCSKEDENWSS